MIFPLMVLHWRAIGLLAECFGFLDDFTTHQEVEPLIRKTQFLGLPHYLGLTHYIAVRTGPKFRDDGRTRNLRSANRVDPSLFV
jgi:hypothetical protein